MSNLIIGYGTQGKKRAKILSFNKKKVFIYDPLYKNSKSNFIKDIEDFNFDKISHAYICLPEKQKKKYLEKLLCLNKHVLVEKPLIFKKNEILALQRKLNSTSYTAYNHRFEPHLINIKRFLKKSAIGEIYNVKIYYGNGTAKLWQGSWRSKDNFSILYDLGSHVLDTILFLFNKLPNNFNLNIAQKNELPCYDYLQFSSKGNFTISSTLSILNWQNYFYLDILGSKGSMHLNGLCKWGPSILKINKRVLPSGFPNQKIYKIRMKDPTWYLEEKYFKNISKKNYNNLGNDLLINKSIDKIKC